MWQWNPSLCLAWFLTDEHFLGELQHVDDVSAQKVKSGPIRTREIGGVILQEELFAWIKKFNLFNFTHATK